MKRLKIYYNKVVAIDFRDFNSFLFGVILRGFLKTENMLPAVLGILIVYLGIDIEVQSYVFFPQSNITAYLTFIVLQIAIGLTILLVVPFTMIILFNYLCSMIQHINPRLMLPIKFILLVLTFTYSINVAIDRALHIHEKTLIILIWVALYFFLINTYIAYQEHNHPLKFSRGKSFFTVIFILMVIHPLSGIFSITLQKINYIQVNPLVNLPAQICELIVRHPNLNIDKDNRTINDSKYFEQTAQGCDLYGNIVRTGFSSDYSISIKDNIKPIIESGISYNYYTRINCYSGACFVENNIKHQTSKDEYDMMFVQHSNMLKEQD